MSREHHESWLQCRRFCIVSTLYYCKFLITWIYSFAGGICRAPHGVHTKCPSWPFIMSDTCYLMNMVFVVFSKATSHYLSFSENGLLCNSDVCRMRISQIFISTWMYEKVLRELVARAVYREVVIAVSGKRFDASAIRLVKQTSCLDGKTHSFWLVQARHACFWVLIDPRSFLDAVVSAKKCEVKWSENPNLLSWRTWSRTTPQSRQFLGELTTT